MVPHESRGKAATARHILPATRVQLLRDLDKRCEEGHDRNPEMELYFHDMESTGGCSAEYSAIRTTDRDLSKGAGMGIVLGPNQYGKAENRVVRVYRDTDRHEIRDLNVSTSLRGDFSEAHITGDQGDVLPTDTQKNTAFAFAKEKGVISPEQFGLTLGAHFLDVTPKATASRIGIEEYTWERIEVNGSG